MSEFEARTREELTPIYVAHPLGSGDDRQANRRRAAEWAGWMAENFFVIPIAPWIYLSEVWPETDEKRNAGLNLDLALLNVRMEPSHERARRLTSWLVGGRISPGMELERAEAVLSIDLTYLGDDPPDRGTMAELPLAVVKLMRPRIPLVSPDGKWLRSPTEPGIWVLL